MIKHIVFFKLKEGTPQNIEKAAQALRDMEGKIEVLRSIEVGVDFIRSERSYDIALTTTFDNKEDLQIYQDHEVHMPVKKYAREVCESIFAVDYEV